MEHKSSDGAKVPLWVRPSHLRSKVTVSANQGGRLPGMTLGLQRAQSSHKSEFEFILSRVWFSHRFKPKLCVLRTSFLTTRSGSIAVQSIALIPCVYSLVSFLDSAPVRIDI